jgi:dimethylargininase
MFTEAIVRPPGVNYPEALTTMDLGTPNYALAIEQHAAYCEALERCGLMLTRLAADERYPDSTFVEDMAVLLRVLPHRPPSARLPGREHRDQPTTPKRDSVPGAILTRPGAASRVGEVEQIAETLSQFYSELHSIYEPGTVDGGDVCEASKHFFIGISQRTNEAGARQLAEWLVSYGCTTSFVDIRRIRNILHLKSGLAYLGDHRLVVINDLAGHKEFRNYDLVRVSLGEEYAANCIRVNDHVLVAAGYPRFERTLRELGYQTIALEMTEFQKMDGGLSCLSLRF